MSRELQINLPPEMRCEQIEDREFDHWLAAMADIDAEKKRNHKQKEQTNEQG